MYGVFEIEKYFKNMCIIHVKYRNIMYSQFQDP